MSRQDLSQKTISLRTATLLVVLVAVAGIGGYVIGRMAMPMAATVPPVNGFYKGQDILFIHTEASDANVAKMLTDMMGSQVILVPNLGKIPASLLGDVYVFANGIKTSPSGPFGFQPDVFSSAPGDSDYSPLRAVNLVTWKEGASPRVLSSVEDVKAAELKGELTIARLGIVVNMPFLNWPGGQR